MTEYRAIVTDFKTGEITTVAPLISMEAANELNQAETISVTVPLFYEPAISSSVTTSTEGLENVDNYYPARNAIYIERDGVLIYGGVIWALPSIDVGGETVQVAAKGMLSYLRRRRIRNDISFSGSDQDANARQIVEQADGVAIDTVANAHGVTNDHFIYGFDRLTVERALQNAAFQDGGFDYYFSHGRTGDTITSTFRTSYPATGRATEAFIDAEECGSFVVSFDGTEMVNFVDVMAGTVGEDPIIETVSNSGSTSTFPRLDDTVSADSFINRSLLAAVGRRRLVRGAEPTIRAALTKSPDVGPGINEYLIGDQIRCRAVVGGLRLDRTFRIIGDGLSVTPNGLETHSLTLASLEAFNEGSISS